jgi:hypothetical protein
MALITYNVQEARQTSSGADYIVKYTAEVETNNDPSDVQIVMVSLYPGSEEIYIQAAVESVREAAVEVLSAYGIGAVVRLHDFVIHPVDFSPQRCKEVTKRYLAEALKQGR